MLRDVDGKSKRALAIFTHAIAHLKKMLLQDARAKQPSLKDEDVSWVVTVPAIWSDASKQFMREAAENVGLSFAVHCLYF